MVPSDSLIVSAGDLVNYENDNSNLLYDKEVVVSDKNEVKFVSKFH
jgi:hypothetical protein